jgi:hypothetical protein
MGKGADICWLDGIIFKDYFALNEAISFSFGLHDSSVMSLDKF